jgi:hypothetical protein
MNRSFVSSLEDINAALQSHNPFSQPPFVNANNVWGKGFPDVETLNAHASDAVFQALEQIRTGHYPTTSILITAQNGTGKTHIISRIRHRLQVQGGASFVFANKYGDLNQIKSGFQQILADSLSNIGSQGVRQWQELATAMANQALRAINPNAQTIAPKDLVKKFENSSEEQVKKVVNQLAKAFCKTKDVKDPDIVRAIFWTLSDEQALYAFNWLAGKELAQFKANELRLPSQQQSLDAVLQILSLISEYNELVICFDELDFDFNDAGLHKSQIVAGLVKELFENLNRGIILSVMMPGTWNERVKQLPGGVWSKMSASGNPYNLKYIDGDSIIELVTFSLREYYEAKSLVPPYPIYPFNENELRDIGKGKPTVREVLEWCRDNCKPLINNGGDGGTIEPKPDLVELAFISELEEELGGYLDNNFLLADALLFGFQTLIGQTVEQVTIQEVTDRVKKNGGKDQYLNFKIIGKEDGKDVSIGVAVLQYDGGKALGAGFRRLIDEKNFNLTRGCLVRSKNKRLTSHLKRTYLEPFINEEGGEFVDLKEEEIRPLIAIQAVHQKREVDYGLSEEQIFKFITEKGAEKKLGAGNPLLREILSDPSHQVPAIEEEPETSAESSVADTSDSVEANELPKLIGNE